MPKKKFSKRKVEDDSSPTEDIAKQFERVLQESKKRLDAQESATKEERKALEEERELYGAIVKILRLLIRLQKPLT